jgi:hypothetical protein
MFEAGSQDQQKTFGPFPVAQEGDFPDLPTNSWFDYAANEGIPRAPDLFDRHGVKASSFMTGMSVERYPHIAREIVKRGHEAGARSPLGALVQHGSGRGEEVYCRRHGQCRAHHRPAPRRLECPRLAQLR